MEKKGQMDYVIKVNGQHLIFHANMLKWYMSQQETASVCVEEVSSAAVIEDSEEDPESQHIVLPSIDRKETWRQVNTNENLPKAQEEEGRELLQHNLAHLTLHISYID